MIVNLPLVSAVLGGSAIGLGLFLVVREAMPATPALGPALRRLHAQTGTTHARGRGRIAASRPCADTGQGTPTKHVRRTAGADRSDDAVAA